MNTSAKKNQDTSYVLEGKGEFDRLERQSTFPKYDYRNELTRAAITLPKHARILDAGCGSGVVSRHLAQKYSGSQITGLDFSGDRIALAQQAAGKIPNLVFQQGDVTQLNFESNSLDFILCRYVLQHVLPKQRMPALTEFLRCLKPGAKCAVVDFDGAFYNIYPRTPLMEQLLSQAEATSPVDLRIGRKLPQMLLEAGFASVHWQIETIECQGTALEQEREMVSEKLESLQPFLTQSLGSASAARQFSEEYLNTMKLPGVVLFYNKFIVTAEKPPTKRTHLSPV